MQKQNKKYLLIFFLILFCGLLATAAVNVIIDPAGIFKIIEKEGFNAEKTELMRGGGRRDKALALKRGRFDTVILGTSRSEVGINPESPAFGKAKVYNASLPYSHMDELYSVFKFVREKGDVKRVIIGLDFLLFTSQLKTRADFNESLFAVDSPFKIINNIFSLDELSRSIDTLRDNLKGKRARHSNAGHRYRLSVFKKVGGHRNFFNVKLSKGFRSFARAKPPTRYHRERLKLLDLIIKESKEADIELILFISPVHARLTEALRIISLMDDYVRWQRELVEIISKNPEVKLWDFSGASTITSEVIPPSGDSTTKMRWYWDGSHYKSAVGDIIIERLLGKETKGFADSGFGVLINNKNIEKHLFKKQRAQEAYRLKYPDEIAEIEGLKKKATEDTNRAL